MAYYSSVVKRSTNNQKAGSISSVALRGSNVDKTCTCIVPDNATIGDYIKAQRSTIELATVNVFVGRHAVGKSILMASLYNSLLVGIGKSRETAEESQHRYSIVEQIECNYCAKARYSFWLPAERVVLPFAYLCTESEKLRRRLERLEQREETEYGRPGIEHLLYKDLKDFCRWQENLIDMITRVPSPIFLGMSYSYVMEALEKAIKIIYDIRGGKNDIEEYLYRTLPYILLVERNEDEIGEPHYALEVLDMRIKRRTPIQSVSHAVSTSAVVTAVSLATAYAFIDKTLLAIEEPEEEAHPYAQFILGYLLSYVALKTRLDPRSHGFTLLVTTHSEYVLSGMLRAAYDTLKDRQDHINTLRPRIYVVDYANAPGDDKIVVEVREWKPGDIIPGFFGTALPLTISPRKLRELYGTDETQAAKDTEM